MSPKSVSNQALHIITLDFAVQDAEGFVYSTELEWYFVETRNSRMVKLTESAAKSEDGFLIAIPKDAIVSALYVEATTFGAEVLIADLSLF